MQIFKDWRSGIKELFFPIQNNPRKNISSRLRKRQRKLWSNILWLRTVTFLSSTVHGKSTWMPRQEVQILLSLFSPVFAQHSGFCSLFLLGGGTGRATYLWCCPIYLQIVKTKSFFSQNSRNEKARGSFLVCSSNPLLNSPLFNKELPFIAENWKQMRVLLCLYLGLLVVFFVVNCCAFSNSLQFITSVCCHLLCGYLIFEEILQLQDLS